MADMTTIKGRIAETIYPNGKGAITAESHQALLLEMVDDINEKKADKEEVTTVEESVSMLSQEVESNYINLTESLDALEQKLDNLPQGGGDFDPSGTYPNLTAGDLAGRGESVPASFGFRASGGKSIKDGRAYIKRIKGNSVVWNQMNESPDFSMLNSFSAVGGASHTSANGVLSVTLGASNYSGVVDMSIYSKIQVNHTYLFITRAKANTTLNNVAIPYISNYGISPKNTLTTSYQIFAKIFKVTANSTTTGPCRAGEVGTDFNAGDVIDVNMYCVIDLTQMFQAGNEPSTIEEFNARVATLGIDMNAYNEGEVIHCNTESIKSVGDNAWGGTLEKGRLTNGIDEVNNNMVRSDDYIRILPSQEYYALAANNIGKVNFYPSFYDADKNYISGLNATKNFSTPTNAMYMRFFLYDEGGVMPTDYNGLMITLVHSGWKLDTDAGYQPYWQDILPLPIIRKYFPDGMKKAGTAHDEIRFNKTSGKWEYSKGKIKSVDLGSLTFSEWQDGMYAANLADMAIKGQILCAKYSTDTYTNVTAKNTGIAALTDKGGIVIYDATYTTPSAIKTDLQGIILYYEAAEWEWVELDAEDQNFRDYYQVADFGTEMSQSNNVPSAAFSADIIYQFNAVDMIREHELEITELQKVIATMQAQLTSLTNGGQ